MNRSLIHNLTKIYCAVCFLLLGTLLLVIESKLLVFLLVVMMLPFLGLILYTISYIKNEIIQPIESLKNEAELISRGTLSHKIRAQSNNEIGQFISAFDKMRSALYKQQQVQKTFELERKNFVSSIAHDLRTPLASISAYIEALQDGMVSTQEEEKHYYKIIESKISVLSELSNQLSMSYETPENLSVALKKVSCYTWSTDFLDDMRLESRMQNIHIDLANQVLVSDDSAVLIDIQQLDRVLFNLTSNALRYHDKLFAIATSIDKQMFTIQIKNDGAKIKSENLSKLFDRFYTEEEPNEQGHLGLGLYLSKTIVTAMGGSIEVEKKLDIIQFKVRLPII